MSETEQEACTCHGNASRRDRPVGLEIEPGHVLDTLYQEHDAILAMLDEIEAAVRGEIGTATRARLTALVKRLIAAEPHHRREEDVLFPELTLRGIVGPPEVMTREHEHLRHLKHALERTLAAGAPDEAVRAPARALVALLTDHIARENRILYPLALRVIDDEETWRRLRQECDGIGYCCFTPGETTA